MVQTPLNDSQVRALQAGPKRSTHALGNSLLLVVEPALKGGGKRFVGRYRFPPGRSGKQKEYALGVYGKGHGQLTLKEARDTWTKIRAWGLESGEDLQLYKQSVLNPPMQQDSPTLGLTVKEYLATSRHRESTRKDYANCLNNQVLPVLGAETPLSCFAFSDVQRDGRTGRRIVLDMKKDLEKRAPVQADKALMVLRQVFGYAIDQGWMSEPNPAQGSRHARSSHVVQHHPSLTADQLPTFFECLNRNEPKGSLVIVSAVKILFLSFLRVGSLAGIRWSEIDEEESILTIPAERMKSKKSHVVPLTQPMVDVFEPLRDLTGESEYVFDTGRGGLYPHIHPSSINAHLVKLGYKGMLRAHGVRSIPLTIGQDILGFSPDVIRRQLAHAIGDKVRQAYDRSSLLKERRDFMLAWSDYLLDQGLKV